MRRLLPSLVVVFALMVPVAPASAAPGNGAYEPFPTPTPDSHASGFYGDLGANLSQRAIRRGVYVRGEQPPRVSGEPSARAGLHPDGAGVIALVLVLLVAAGIATACALRSADRRVPIG